MTVVEQNREIYCRDGLERGLKFVIGVWLNSRFNVTLLTV